MKKAIVKHTFLELAEAQKLGKTLYCGGLDIHDFGGTGDLEADYLRNMTIYCGNLDRNDEGYDVYRTILSLTDPGHKEASKLACLLAAIEKYCKFVMEVLVVDCGVYVMKPQFGLCIQLAPLGLILLQRLRRYAQELEMRYGVRIVVILDCKPGDVATTQIGYMRGFMGDLKSFGVDYTPFDFDAINPTPWMGEDVLLLEKDGMPLYGLELLHRGKGLIYVNKTSNPTGPQYQDLLIDGDTAATRYLQELGIAPTLQMCNAADAHLLSQQYNLEHDELSQLGLVVGATRFCDGSIRKVFPSTTLLNPGFGAQSVGKDHLSPFRKVMMELIREGKWNGQGCIFSSSRGTMFPWMEKYGGRGKVENLKTDLIASVARHRDLEAQMYELPEVVDAGIINPFK